MIRKSTETSTHANTAKHQHTVALTETVTY